MNTNPSQILKKKKKGENTPQLIKLNNIKKKNYRPTSFMNKDVNLNKTSKNSAAYRKGLYTNTNWENLKNVTWFSISKSIDLIHHITRIKYKPHDHLSGCKNIIWQNPLIKKKKQNKTLNQLGIEGIFPNMIKDFYEKPTANILF